MTPEKEWYEQAATEENEWVRAVILKPNHPAKSDALEVATKAQKMARGALGEHHPAYAEAIQNLGLYFSVIEKNAKKATEFFDQARGVVGPYHPVLSRTFYFLAMYYQEAGDVQKAEHFFAETMTILRHEGYPYDPRIAQILAKLADMKLAAGDRNEALKLLKEVVAIQQKALSENDPDRKATDKKIKSIQRSM